MDLANFTWKHIFSISMVLFSVIDIVGSIPAILSLRERSGSIHAEKATMVSFIIMIAFLYLGESILNLVGVDVQSFAIAGSLVIFFIALEMLLGIRIYRDDIPATASVVPLAFPLIAGTGTMTTLLSLRAEYNALEVVVGIVFNMILVYLVLKNLGFLEKLLGKAGISIMRKVFGIVLLAIAVKLFKNNLGL